MSLNATSSGASRERPVGWLTCRNPRCCRPFSFCPSLRGHVVACPQCEHETVIAGNVATSSLDASPRLDRLRVVAGPGLVQAEWALEPHHAYLIGKAESCEIRLPVQNVSRRHAILRQANGRWEIEDQQSTNGVQVNDVSVARRELDANDVIRVGGFELQYLAPYAPTELAAMPAAVARPTMLQTYQLAQAEESSRPPDSHRVAPAAVRPIASQAAPVSRARTPHRAVRRPLLAGVIAACILVVAFGAWWLSRSAHVPEFAGASDNPKSAIAASTDRRDRLRNAIDHERWHDATALIDDARNNTDPASEALAETLTGAVEVAQRRYASRALAFKQQREWAAVRKLAESLLAEPAFRNFESEWREISLDSSAGELLDRVMLAEREGEVARAFELLRSASGSLATQRDVVQRGAEMRESYGAGLVIDAFPPSADIRVRVDGQFFEDARRAIWRLPEGVRKVVVEADSFLPAETSVSLDAGKLTRHALRLRPRPSAGQWVLYALRKSEKPRAVWLAATMLSADQDSGIELSSEARSALEAGARRGLPQSPRVARVSTRDGRELVGIVVERPGGIAVRERFPSGTLTSFKTDDIREVRDLSSAVAADVLCSHLDDSGAAETLEHLGMIVLLLGDDVRQADGFLHAAQRALCELRAACAACGGAQRIPCAKCKGAGVLTKSVDCTKCSAQGSLDCAKCSGTGKAPCASCKGTGEKMGAVCSVCAGVGAMPCKACPLSGGKITCEACKGRKRIESHEDCDACGRRKVVACETCAGKGTRDAITPAKRDELDREIAESDLVPPPMK